MMSKEWGKGAPVNNGDQPTGHTAARDSWGNSLAVEARGIRGKQQEPLKQKASGGVPVAPLQIWVEQGRSAMGQ